MTERRFTDRLRAQLPEITLPKLGREVSIPVYVIHNSIDPEDYFFLFDFEQFVEQSKGGLFVRPGLKVWAGRDDFGRSDFAHQFRETFAAEFDRMRAEVAGGKKKGMGWLSWDLAFLVPDLLGWFLAHIVLLVATSTGKALLGSFSLPSWLKGKSKSAKLEDEIDKTKGQVEEALRRIDVSLHRELYDHAFRDGPRGPVSGIDREAWPLPGYVRAHLGDGKSGSWW